MIQYMEYTNDDIYIYKLRKYQWTPHFSPPDCRQVLQSHFSPLVQGSASSGKVPLGRMEKMGFFEKLRENRPKFDGWW